MGEGTPRFDDITALCAEYRITKDEAENVLKMNDCNLDKSKQWLKMKGQASQTTQQPLQITNHPHNSNTSVKTAEELEFEKAIQLSLQDQGTTIGGGDDMDPELAKVLELSKKQTSGAPTSHPVVDLTGEGGDADIQATLLASIQSASGRSPIVTDDPSTLQRQGELPVGLKNVGNTCYLNSLIQTYFMIPILRKAIISYAPSVRIDESDPNHAFMLELQKLFCAMVLSNQRFVDPSNLLKKIVDDQGKPVSIGAQEDVSEFNDIFMTRLTKGLDLVHPPLPADADGQPANPLTLSNNPNVDQTSLTNGRLQRMFVPNAVEVVKSLEPDDTPIEQSNALDFGRNFLLPVTEETNLFAALDKFMSDEVPDYETPKGHKMPAVRWKWLKHVPEVLFFQQQRAVWQGDSHQKANHRLSFPEELHMGRYHINNTEFVTATRLHNAERMRILSQLQTDIEPYLNFDASGVRLDTVLDGAIKYLDVLSRTCPGSERVDLARQAVDMLRTCKLEESQKLESLQAQKNQLAAELEESFASLNSSDPHRLFAVWVHAGAAVGGHYWAYIRDPVTDEWYKLNDTDSSRVELPTVLEDGYGGKGVTSAYFLIYMKDSLYKRCKQITNKAEGIPEALRAAMEASNAQFEQKLKQHQEYGVDGQMEKFVKAYNAKIAQTHEYANKFTMEKDMRYYSVFAFLLSIGLEEEMMASVASEIWLRTFNMGIHKSQSSVAFEKLCAGSQVPETPPNLTSVLFKAVAINENDAEKKQKTAWDDEFANLRTMFMFFQQGLRLLMKPDNSDPVGITDRQDALRHIYLAYLRNEKLKYEITKRRDLEALLQLAVLACYQDAVRLVQTHLSTTLNILDDVAYVILRLPIVIGENIKALVLDATFTTLIDRNPLFADESRASDIQERLINGLEPKDKRWETYSTPKMPTELSEWENLILSTRDTYENLKRKFLGMAVSLGIPELYIFVNSTTSTSPLPQNQTVSSDSQLQSPTSQAAMGTSPASVTTGSIGTDSTQSTTPMNVDSMTVEGDLGKIAMSSPSSSSTMDVDNNPRS